MKTTKIKIILSSVLTLCIIFSGNFVPHIICSAQSQPIFEPLIYPDEAVTDFDTKMFNRVSSGADYISNCGYNENGLYISPYWSCEILGENIPVYAVMSYDEDINGGVLQSVVTIFVKDFANGIDITLDSKNAKIKSAVILPSKLGAIACIESTSVNFTAMQTGAYTCLINGDSLSYAITVFVKEYTDENVEINSYIERYGKDRVKIFSAGFYELEYIDTSNCDVIYFCRGSYVSAKHIYDVQNDDNLNTLPERRAFLDVFSRDGFVIDGRGTVDFNRLDRKERSHMNVSYSKNCSFSGLTFINPSDWTVTVYATTDSTVDDFTIFGYRTNSDAINICGCENMKITNCFARNGDDCFSVKTTNADYGAKNITFENCIGWSNKCRCFGITGEVFAPIESITFTDCDVIYRNATWDNDRVASLVVAVEMGGAPINDVLFENVEIYRDDGRAFYCVVNNDIENCKISGIVFRNVSYSSGESSKIATRQSLNGSAEKFNAFIYRLLKFFFSMFEESFSHLIPGNNSLEVKLENVVANGEKLNSFNLKSNVETIGNEKILF